MINLFHKINKTNSTIGVQCDAEGKCDKRFTQLCNDCVHNSGPEKGKSYYKPRD